MDLRELTRAFATGEDIPDTPLEGDTEDARATATNLSYRELVPKLLKTSLPLIILIGFKYLLEYSVPISLYICWVTVFQNLTDDFSAHFVFRNSDGAYRIGREFIRTLLLLVSIIFLLDSNKQGYLLKLLYFSSSDLDKDSGKYISYTLYDALIMDILVRTLALTVKILLNILVPFARSNSLCGVGCFKANCFIRKISRRYDEYCRNRAVTSRDLVIPGSGGSSRFSTLRRRGDQAEALSLLEAGQARHTEGPEESQEDALVTDVEEKDVRDLRNFIYMKRMNIFLDNVIIVYRHLIPMQLWLVYFAAGPYSALFCFLYVVIKSVGFSLKFRSVMRTGYNLFFERFEYGTYASETDLLALSNRTCSICYDTFQRPVCLGCNHIFCEHCILEWLQRDLSCPICRHAVTKDPDSTLSSGLSSAFPVVI